MRRTFFKAATILFILFVGLSGVGVGLAQSLPERGGPGDAEETRHPAFYRSVTEFGPVGTNDDSETFQAAFEASKHISIPAGTFRVSNLVPRNGTTIIASRDAVIQGVTANDAIFRTDQFTHGIVIEGGKWTQADYVWLHTGGSALASSSFMNMALANLGSAGFSLSAAVGNRWEDCSFGGGYDYGLLFTGTGHGQTNVNWIENTQFMKWRVNAIHFADTSVPKFTNHIVHSWFEEGDGTAIFVGGGVTGLRIASGYFEEAGTLDQPDIDIIQAQGGNITSVLVENNHFSPTWSDRGQTVRIRNRGHSGYAANNNTVVLRVGETFASIEGQVNRNVRLQDNFLNAVGGGTYESRLFSRQSNQHLVWNALPGSGFVTEDEDPRLRYIGGPASTN